MCSEMLVPILVINTFFVISASPLTEYNGKTFKNALNQQGLQTVLQSIEERLRNLDQIYSTRYGSGSVNNDQFLRKIETLENKLSRMETQMEIQLEKISENMSSKNFKDDISKDQIFRKIDSVYERMNHKLSYVEGKMDMDFLKLQTKIESVMLKIERLDHSFSVRQADMEAEFSDAVEMMENVKNNVESVENKLINITKNTIESTFQGQTNLIQNKFDNLVDQINIKINNSIEKWNYREVLNDYSNKDVSKTIKGYEDQIQTYGNKVNNMYNELWKKSSIIENTMKHSVLLMNLTRKDIQDLKKAGHKITTYNSQNDGQLEVIVDSFTNTIQRKFTELGKKIESNFENVMLIQNLFLESCHRIQMDESQLENKISLVLEKLLDAVTNRSFNYFKEFQTMEELIKSHDSNVYRTLIQNTNTIIKLSEKTSDDRRKLEKILSTMKKDIGSIVKIVQDEISSEDQDNNQKYDTIANLLLELQEQVNDLDSRVNEDNINYNAKQILPDILIAIKSLPEKETYLQKLNISIGELSNLMKNIYHLLTSADSKIDIDYQPTVNKQPGIINNTTKEPAITNFSEDNLNEDEVTEPMEVVWEILPERVEKENKNSSLSRFNYTLITDNTLRDEIKKSISTNPKNNKENVTLVPAIVNYYLLLQNKRHDINNQLETIAEESTIISTTNNNEISMKSDLEATTTENIINLEKLESFTEENMEKIKYTTPRYPEKDAFIENENIASKGFKGSENNITSSVTENNNISSDITTVSVTDIPVSDIKMESVTTEIFDFEEFVENQTLSLEDLKNNDDYGWDEED